MIRRSVGQSAGSTLFSLTGQNHHPRRQKGPSRPLHASMIRYRGKETGWWAALLQATAGRCRQRRRSRIRGYHGDLQEHPKGPRSPVHSRERPPDPAQESRRVRRRLRGRETRRAANGGAGPVPPCKAAGETNGITGGETVTWREVLELNASLLGVRPWLTLPVSVATRHGSTTRFLPGNPGWHRAGSERRRSTGLSASLRLVSAHGALQPQTPRPSIFSD